MTFVERFKWRNRFGNKEVEPLATFKVRDLYDIIQAVQQAEADQVNIKAFGGGYSFSEVAMSKDYMIDTRDMDRILDLDPQTLRANVKDPSKLIYVESGITLQKLNRYLEFEKDLALPNGGGYSQQTLGGTLSTSTHGSGINFGPYNEQVEAIEIVAGNAKVYRIERKNGPTDPAAFKKIKRKLPVTLVQNDQWFNAVNVNLGCMGVVYAYIIRTVDSFWLTEVREKCTWEQTKDYLLYKNITKDKNRYIGFYINPHTRMKKGKRERFCVVSRKNIATDIPVAWSNKRRRNLLTDLAASMPLLYKTLQFFTGLFPKLTPWLMDVSLSSLIDDQYTDKGYKALMSMGPALPSPAYASELSLEIRKDNSHIKALEEIFNESARRAKLGNVYQGGLIAVRVVKKDDSYLSMAYGRNTMTIESLMLDNTMGGKEILYSYEKAVRKHKGRPHWGMLNDVNGKEAIEHLYGKLPLIKWEEVRKKMDPRSTFGGSILRKMNFFDSKS